MNTHEISKLTRRDLMRTAGILAGGAIGARIAPEWLLAYQRGDTPAGANMLDQMRAQMAMAPIETVELTDNLRMLSGPGGNIIVFTGADGKIVVDSFVQPVFPKLKQMIDGMGSGRIKMLIDTHWHFDHTDNNANFHQTVAAILAHENTKKRLSETHDLMGMHFAAAPPEALPTETFKTTHALKEKGETLHLEYFPPAHTDSDISVHFTTANVLHMGDVFFNGVYPFIDQGTGGNINGMIGGANAGLKLADAKTKVVPGHGPLGDKASLTQYRDMLVTVRDRVRTLKSSGKTADEVVAAKPTADLDATWGKGFLPPDQFVTIVYNTL